MGLRPCQRDCRGRAPRTPACYAEGSVEATGTSSARVLARLLSLLAPGHGQLGTQCAEGTGCVFAQGAWSPAWDKGPLCPQPSLLVRPRWPIRGAPPPSLPCDPSALSTALSLLSMHSYQLCQCLSSFNAPRPPTYTRTPRPSPRLGSIGIPTWCSPPFHTGHGTQQQVPASLHILMLTPDSHRSHPQAQTHHLCSSSLSQCDLVIPEKMGM